jgi:putative transposase
MSDSLYCGVRFRTFNVIDDFNREGINAEVDTSLTGDRLIRVFRRLREERGLPAILRVGNRPKFPGTEFTDWAEANGMTTSTSSLANPIRTPSSSGSIERFMKRS